MISDASQVGFRTRLYCLVTALCLVLLVQVQVQACDACSYYEYNTLQNKSFLGVFYRLRHFNGYSGNGMDPSWRWTADQYRNGRLSHEIENSDTRVWTPSRRDFMQLESWDLRYNQSVSLPAKWFGGSEEAEDITLNLTAQWGYSRNMYYLGTVAHYNLLSPMVVRDSTLSTRGVQDLRLGAAYVKSFFTAELKHTVNAGVLLRVPLGSYQVREASGALIHPELQTGTGAWDIMPRGTYQLVYDDWGFEASGLLRFAGTNSLEYKFGNGYNVSTDVFYMWGLGDNWRIVPRMGLYSEQENYHTQYQEAVAGTGGRASFGTLQADVMYKTSALSIQFQQPVMNRLNGNQLLNAGRLNVGLVIGW